MPRLITPEVEALRGRVAPPILTIQGRRNGFSWEAECCFDREERTVRVWGDQWAIVASGSTKLVGVEEDTHNTDTFCLVYSCEADLRTDWPTTPGELYDTFRDANGEPVSLVWDQSQDERVEFNRMRFRAGLDPVTGWRP